MIAYTTLSRVSNSSWLLRSGFSTNLPRGDFFIRRVLSSSQSKFDMKFDLLQALQEILAFYPEVGNHPKVKALLKEKVCSKGGAGWNQWPGSDCQRLFFVVGRTESRTGLVC